MPVKESELIAFIEHIRKMCKDDKDKSRISAAFRSLRQILERQHVDQHFLTKLDELASEDSCEALRKSFSIGSMDDVDRIISKVYAIRAHREAHRGCG